MPTITTYTQDECKTQSVVYICIHTHVICKYIIMHTTIPVTQDECKTQSVVYIYIYTHIVIIFTHVTIIHTHMIMHTTTTIYTGRVQDAVGRVHFASTLRLRTSAAHPD